MAAAVRIYSQLEALGWCASEDACAVWIDLLLGHFLSPHQPHEFKTGWPIVYLRPV